ncbi:hypothetical protein [Cohnella fermenti]|uniref:Uncharacterized protein n=1 Tax=Cohnella fermenti TaxID=2565925 RepID=A0A4S4CB74_9BACL|nr:hypothetical protein [Cohnella fermenti]THF84693.1 hypothetical protein E6C55_01610 [Cohnella fermenti]
MRTRWLEIELRSELCTATGDTSSGLIDIEIAHDRGLPTVPAKRLKGSLLDVGRELEDWGVLTPDRLRALFGVPGQPTSSRLHVLDAHLYKVPTANGPIVIDEYDALQAQLKQEQWTEQDILSSFTDLYTRTAVDQMTGSAKVHALRTMRAAREGLVLRSRIEIDTSGAADPAELEETLCLCAKGLRRLGLANTRGSGEVRCTLSELEETNQTEDTAYAHFPSIEGPEVDIVPFRLELEQPIMMAGRTGLGGSSDNWIPGGALLGAFAGLYIRAYRLGDRAHEDERFARIFLRGGVQFGYALPLVGDAVFVPCPLSWQREKNTDHGFDLNERSSPEGGVLRAIGSFVYREQGRLFCHQVLKQVRMHHARAANRALGRAIGGEAAVEQSRGLENAGATESPDGGQLYQYESIAPGQTFYGLLRGRAEDVSLLLELAQERGSRLRLGRARTAEYGNVRFVPGGDRLAPLLPSGKKDGARATLFALHLITPLFLLDQDGRPDPNPRWLLEQMGERLECEVLLKQARLRYTVLSGFNAKWRLPKSQREALDAGSTLLVRLNRPETAERLERSLWGWNTGEGEGQIRFVAIDEFEGEGVNWGDGPSFRLESMKTEPLGPAAEVSESEVETHLLVQWLRRVRTEGATRRTGAQAGADEAGKQELKIGSTKIRQLMAWFEAGGRSYASLLNRIEQIMDGELRQLCLRQVEPCEQQTEEFIRGYLRTLELKARKQP